MWKCVALGEACEGIRMMHVQVAVSCVHNICATGKYKMYVAIDYTYRLESERQSSRVKTSKTSKERQRGSGKE